MKIFTLNFLTCARKACHATNASFPLHLRSIELEETEIDLNPLFLQNILPRIEWPALRSICDELGFPPLPEERPSVEELFEGEQGEHSEQGQEQEQDQNENGKQPSKVHRDLHNLLLERDIREGVLVCGNCGHEYAVKEGIANFLLPSHLV